MSWIDWKQAEVLTDRYLSVLMGKLGSLLLFLLLGPIIAGMIVALWAGARADDRLELFLCIAAIFVGCMLACREIVGERAIYQRERMVFLQIPAYVWSKVLVLGAIDGLQAAAMLWIIDRWVGLAGSKLLLFAVLWIAALSGTLLGLVISAYASTPDKAVAMAPLVILPQILFSKPFLPGGELHGIIAWVEKAMPLRWCFELYQEIERLPKDPHWPQAGLDLCVCAFFLAALYGAVCFTLWMQDE